MMAVLAFSSFNGARAHSSASMTSGGGSDDSGGSYSSADAPVADTFPTNSALVKQLTRWPRATSSAITGRAGIMCP
jgi:hypothetical protein